MDYITQLIGQHHHLMQLGGQFGVVIGVLLLLVGRVKRSKSVSASERSVVVGRDNHGTIITGDTGAPPSSTDQNWPMIVGLLLAFASLVVTILAWLAPVKP